MSTSIWVLRRDIPSKHYFTSVYKRILTGPMEMTSSGNPCIGKPGLHLRTGNNQPISLAPYAI